MNSHLSTDTTTTCPDCHGKGWTYYSCCTGRATEYDHCPMCHEPLGEEDCEGCGGTGVVPTTDSDTTLETN